MASTALQLLGFILGVISWIGMIATCASPEWRKNSHGQTIIDNTIRYDGLWAQCKAYPTGQTHCSVYNKFFIGLPSVLQVCRALMIASIALGFIAILITILGIKCTSIGNSNPKAKARAAMIGGLLFLASAVLDGGSVSYYAHGVVQEYYNPIVMERTPTHLRFEYGIALFIGWAALVLGILGGVILTFTSIFVLFRLNSAERRGMLIPPSRGRLVHGRQQHLPLSQHQRNAHAKMHAAAAKTTEDGILTKQRIAQHNAKPGPKNGHSHHVQENIPPRKHEHRPTSLGESSKSSVERRRWSDENAAKQNADQTDASKHHHHHHHHHHMHGSKSEGHLKSRSREEETQKNTTNAKTENADDANGGYTRRRPLKEYV